MVYFGDPAWVSWLGWSAGFLAGFLATVLAWWGFAEARLWWVSRDR